MFSLHICECSAKFLITVHNAIYEKVFLAVTPMQLYNFTHKLMRKQTVHVWDNSIAFAY